MGVESETEEEKDGQSPLLNAAAASAAANVNYKQHKVQFLPQQNVVNESEHCKDRDFNRHHRRQQQQQHHGFVDESEECLLRSNSTASSEGFLHSK